jgi:inner membrane transporter RhtA
MPVDPHPDRAAIVAALGRVVLAGACWALAAVLASYAFDRGVPPVRLAEARVAVALVALAPFLAWRRPDLLRPPPGSWPVLAGFGACVAAVNLSYYLAIDHLPVGVAVALQYTGPAMLLAATALLGGRAAAGLAGGDPGRLAWTAAGLTLAGAVLVSRALEGLGALEPAGLAAGLASAVLFATLGDPGVAAAVLGVGLVGTLLPFALAVGAVRVISAATAGIAATSEPVFAAGFAWLLLGQHLAPAQLAGGALVVAGVVLAQLAAARSRAGAAPVSPDAGGRPGRGG